MGRRYIKSGSGRARGPNDDERSGIDFIIRTIGRHANKKPPAAAGNAADSDSDATESEDELGLGSTSSLSYATPTKPKDDAQQDLLADPLTMSSKQLKGIAGDNAEDLACAYFQHTARVTAPAMFRPLNAMLNFVNDKGETKLFRKGQAGPAIEIVPAIDSLAA